MALHQGEQPGDGEETLEALRPLAGRWAGRTGGRFGGADIEKVGDFVLGGRFFRITTRSKSPREVHEEIGMFSFDEAAGALVLREFHSEGYVNTYARVASDGGTLVFESTHIENAHDPTLRARITIGLEGPDELVETLELATGDRPFERCVEGRLSRFAATG